VVATGTTPSASNASCSTRPTVTTRFGAAGTTVSPYLFLIVTGKTPPSALAAGVSAAPDQLRWYFVMALFCLS
jgi:hypothetical protein